ncbi:GNAT family N-acetyltransferase [Clostridium tunisiense]|uniref:GNAT family N-acetyltransferase n=1 Tax=Clostridium tunisiense TaxID=219748 RepID=UPI000315D96A|nr:GNAT family N-acetyltransferase [Clostridium tunisiense]
MRAKIKSGLSIIKITEEDINKQLIKQLSQLLTYSEPENFEECKKWWEQWFSDKIPGEKLTIIAKEENNIIGVTRFWKTPFCNNKWLIEGLEVIPLKRRKGVGKAIVIEGVRILRGITNEKIFVNISNKNIESKRLHEGLGFKKISSGSLNSYGEYRNHIDEYVLEV